jgi:hypothetical protein
VHPVERLRYVARASGVAQGVLVRETAEALASFASDPQGLVTACRRMIARQPGSGPLLWLAARTLTAPDPRAELRRAAAEADDDPTVGELRHALPDDATVCVLGWPEVIGAALPARGDLEVLVVDVHGEGSRFVQRLWDRDVEAVDVPLGGLGAAAAAADVVLLESAAIGPAAAVCVSGSHAAAAVARHAGRDVWLVGGVGRMLPGRLYRVVEDRLFGDDPWEADDEQVPLDLVASIVGPRGRISVTDAVASPDCTPAPELLRPSE